MNLIAIIFKIFFGIACTKNTTAEKSISTSIVGMEQLLEVERLLLNNLEDYANDLQQKADLIRSAVSRMRLNNENSQSDSEAYLSNPINGFALIRRMHQDWTQWELFMKKSVGEDKIAIIQEHRANLPTSTDLVEAVIALYRLQTTYDLKPDDMAAGLLNGKMYNASLSSQDRFAIGLQLLNEDEVYHAGLWLHSALQSYSDNEMYYALDYKKLTIQKIYADTLLKQDKIKDAANIIEAAFSDDPNDEELEELQVKIKKLTQNERKAPKEYPQLAAGMYELGCRGEFSTQASRLHCRYNSTTTPFLKLAPLKMEEVQMDPYIILYHDVIYESEIDHIKNLAQPELKRAKVLKLDTNKEEVDRIRTSKLAWFADNYTSTLQIINKRIADMTGFDLVGSEKLQVMNYGLGGHYSAHYDFFNLSTTNDVVRVNGDRISTVLFYMSDVEQGGATVFPNVQKAVFPHKGSAVMWYNLNNKGEADTRTLHAACPVIVGSKWVCNKWIRERRQTFTRPCYKP